MKSETKVRAEKLTGNQSASVVPVKTKVRAGRLAGNHNMSVR